MQFELEPIEGFDAPAPRGPIARGPRPQAGSALPPITIQDGVHEGPEDDTTKVGPQQTRPMPFELEEDFMTGDPRKDMILGEIPDSGARKQVHDFSVGVNNLMVDALGVGAEGVDQIMKYLGTSGFLENPGDGVEAVKTAARKLGLTVKDPSTLSERIGRETLQTGILLLASFFAAPAAAASTVGGTGAAVLREMGKFMLKRPGATAAGEAGAVIGGNVGEELSPEGWEQLGSLAGSMVGGGMGMGAATRGPRNPHRGKINTKSRMALGEEFIPDNLTPIAKGARMPDYGQITQAIKGDQMRIEGLIKQTLDNVQLRTKDSPNSPEAAELLRTSVAGAYKRARGLEDGYWSKVDLKRPVATAPIKANLKRMIADVSKSVRSDVLPGDLIAKINKLGPKASIKELNEIRSLVLERLSAHTMDPTKIPQDKMRGALSKMQGFIIDEIQRQYPHDQAMAEARGFSTWLHDRFTRGPIARFGPRQQSDIAMQDPKRIMDNVTLDSRSPREFRDVADVAPEVGDNVEQFFREELRTIADADPNKGLAWLNKAENQRMIKEFPALKAEVDDLTATLTSQLADQKAFNDSSFIKAVQGEGPQVAVDRLFTGANKVTQARDLMARLDGNEPAREGLRDAVVRGLLERASSDPSRAAKIMDSKDVREMLIQILPTDRVQRLDRIIKAAEGQMAGAGSMGSEFYRQTVGRSSRIVGAFMGRWLQGLTGGGTIQVPGQTAEAAFAMQNSLMKDFSPQDMFANAIADPRWERFLMQRTPETRHEWQRAFNQMRALITAKQELLNNSLAVGEGEE